jgi:hypothetical protein
MEQIESNRIFVTKFIINASDRVFFSENNNDTLFLSSIGHHRQHQRLPYEQALQVKPTTTKITSCFPMCGTTSSYQHKHVSLDDAATDDDNNHDDDKEMNSRQRNQGRKRLFAGVMAFFIVVVSACAVFIRIRYKQEHSDAVTAVEHGDDDFFQNTDDDSVLYHGEPEIEDEKSITLDEDGFLNLEALSKATQKAKNVTAGCETTILLMRHCEKTGDGTVDHDGNEHCDYVGHERAHWIPSLFGSYARWPSPSYLYALSPQRGSHITYREVETLQPLANKFGLPIQADYGTNNDVIQDLFRIMSTGHACSKLIVVNWRHHMMPNLARKLGCKSCPREYPDDSFDQVWQLKFVWDVPHTDVYLRSSSSQADSSSSSTPPHTSNRRLRRELKANKADTIGNKITTKKQKKTYEGLLWSVYSYVTYQHFDPLQVSGSVGDYFTVSTTNETINSPNGSRERA